AGFGAGDDVLIIQIRGAGVGTYEFGVLAGTGIGALTLRDNLTSSYAQGGNSAAQVLRVPNYRNVTVQSGGTLTTGAWDGGSGGVVVFRASGAVSVPGHVDVAAKGYRGG